MAASRIIIPCTSSILPTCNPNLMPFHIDYTGPANVSKFMKIEKVKPEELVVEPPKEPVKDPDFPLVVDVVDVVEVGEAPMDTDADAPGTGTVEPKPLKRTATDVEMHDSMTSVTTADTHSDIQISTATTTTTTATLLVSRTESTIIESQTTTSSSTLASSSSSSSSSNSLSPHPTTATPTTLLEDADKRFVSTFRGRTIHGLTIDLPPGYGGLVLRREGNDVVDPATGGPADVDVEVNGKGRAKANGKTRSAGTKGEGKEEQRQQSKKPPPRRGRLTRSAALSKPEIIAVEEGQPVLDEDEDEKMADPPPTSGDVDNNDDSANGGSEEVPNEHPVRRLIPHAQFSSFTLWHQDRPVDKGRDEYCRTLTEWIALSHEIHRTDL
ncbi:hypothetical protein M413DRAFT_447012 [Hebeloma cylindrosporum]|uniref:Uncharacterized protein n=1 Tax=Hebeloma cylindrosporum TaxID=76867 RepID=A0A0C3C7F2_HEBCY|nr:hypothetical protein M413DRAFT_447012 [Hebeloma cylindrosporum h7]